MFWKSASLCLDSFLFFICMWKSRCAHAIWWKDGSLLSIVLPLLPCQRSIDHIYMSPQSFFSFISNWFQELCYSHEKQTNAHSYWVVVVRYTPGSMWYSSPQKYWAFLETPSHTIPTHYSPLTLTVTNHLCPTHCKKHSQLCSSHPSPKKGEGWPWFFGVSYSLSSFREGSSWFVPEVSTRLHPEMAMRR